MITFNPKLRRTTFLVAVLGMVCLALSEMNFIYLALITVVSVVGWVREKKQRKTLLSRRILNVVLILAVLWAGVDFFVLDYGWIQSLAHFLLIAQMAKLLLPKSDRDYAQIYVISLMNVAVAAIVTVFPAFALVFVLYSGFAIYGLILYHFHLEVRGNANTYLPGESEIVRPEASVDFSPVVSRRFTWMLTTVILCAWVFNAVFFLFSPRLRAGIVRVAPGGFLSRLTGFSDRISLGSIGQILENDTPVMHVKLTDGEGNVLRGERNLYFRGLTYHYYNGKDWQRLGQNISARRHPARVDLPFSEGRLGGPVGADWITQEITLEPIDTRTLFAMPGVVSLRSGSLRQAEVNYLDMTFRCRATPPRPIKYTVTSYASSNRSLYPTRLRQSRGRLDAEQHDAYTLLPHVISDEIKQKARDFVPDRRTLSVLQIAQRIESRLQQEYDYTLELRATRGVEPVYDFLFNIREGHCEYFASSMVVLLRSLQIPSRLVSGFHGAEWNEVAQWYVVKQSHAHAWVEVYDARQGWVTFDPTPASSRNERAGGSAMGIFGRWIDYIRISWLNHVVEYDEEQQGKIVEGTRRATRRVRHRFGSTLASVGRFFRSIFAVFTDVRRLATFEGVMTVAGTLAFSTAVVLLARWLLRRMMRRLKTRLAHRHARRSSRAHIAFYQDLQRVLKHKGFVREPAATPREFAQRVADEIAEVRDALDQLTDTFYAVRFGGGKLKPDDERRLRDAIETVRSAPTAPPP